MLKNYIKIAWKVLLRKRLYTAITLFGISITLMFVILISAFYNHLNAYESPRTKFDRVLSLTIVRYYQKMDDGKTGNENNSPPSYDFIKKYVKTLKTPEAVSAISFMPEYIDVYKNQKKTSLVLRYTDSELWSIADFQFLYGRPFNNKEFQNAERLAVIDDYTAKILYGTDNAIGKEIQVNNNTLRICGVIKSVGITRLRLAGNIYMPVTVEPANLSKEITGRFTALVLAKNKGDFKEINAEFQNVIKNIQLPDDGSGRNSLEAILDKGFFSAIVTAFNIPRKKLAHIIFITISMVLLFYLILPSINLVNINVNRIYERSSEIGARKAFGASSGNIIKQFLIENIFITILGGILGFLFAFIAIQIINASEYISATHLNIDFKTVVFGIFVSMILGILSGVLPAWRMSRLKIVNSLKQD